MGNTVYFYMSSLLLYILQMKLKNKNIASDENIMGNNYIVIMWWNLSVISHLIFHKAFFDFWHKI